MTVHINEDTQPNLRLQQGQMVSILLAGTRSNQPATRIRSLKALAKLNDQRAMPVFLQALASDNFAERSTAMLALKGFGEIAVWPLIDRLASRHEQTRLHVMNTLVWLRDVSLSALLDALHDDDPRVREGAAATLVQMGDAARPGLEDKLDCDDPFALELAAFALEMMSRG